MSNEPIKNAYPDEQEKLDKEREDEAMAWAEVNEVLSRTGYDLKLRLVDGVPAVDLVRVA